MRASPLAKTIARERGVDAERRRGHGPGRPDRRARRRAGRRAKRPAARGARAAPRAPRRRPSRRPRRRRVELGEDAATTARRMAEAKRDIPHFYASSDVAMDECARLKEGLAELEGEYDGHHLHPPRAEGGRARAAARARDERQPRRRDASCCTTRSTSVSRPRPTRGSSSRWCATAIASRSARWSRRRAALVERARAGKFAADDLRGGTFTVSNLGMYPVSHFAAVVNPPQAAILAVGAVREVPVVRDGAVVARSRHDGDAVLRPSHRRRCARRPLPARADGAPRSRRWRWWPREPGWTSSIWSSSGAGPGGYVAAIRAAQLGLRTAVVERGARRRRVRQLGLHPVEGDPGRRRALPRRCATARTRASSPTACGSTSAA